MMNVAMRYQQQMMSNKNNNTPLQQQQQQPPPPPQSVPVQAACQQLLRSKSLNDISIDSQISAFASDRFINLPMPNQGGGNGDPQNVRVCMPAEQSYLYQQQTHNTQQHLIYSNLNNGTTHNTYTSNTPFDNNSHQQNLNTNNNNQCSRPSTTNVFNLCSPLASLTTLNGVTEQIGNLHL